MLEESAQEFVGIKAHRSTRVILASAIAEGDALFVDVDNGLVGEGRSIDVAAEVLEHRFWPLHYRLRESDPAFVEGSLRQHYPGHGLAGVLCKGGSKDV